MLSWKTKQYRRGLFIGTHPGHHSPEFSKKSVTRALLPQFTECDLDQQLRIGSKSLQNKHQSSCERFRLCNCRVTTALEIVSQPVNHQMLVRKQPVADWFEAGEHRKRLEPFSFLSERDFFMPTPLNCSLLTKYTHIILVFSRLWLKYLKGI